MPIFENGEQYQWPITREPSLPGTVPQWSDDRVDDRVDAALYAVSAAQLDMSQYRLQMDNLQRQEMWPSRLDQAEVTMDRLQDLQAVPRIRQYEEPAPCPRVDNDAIAMRLWSHVNRTHPLWGVFGVPKCLQLGHLAKDWAKLWENLGLAHTATVFMLEIRWNGKEHKFDNADAIRATLGL